MQDRHRQLGKIHLRNARPDHTFGSFAPHAVYVLQRLMSGAPRKRQLATEERRVVNGQKVDIGRTREIRPLPVARGGSVRFQSTNGGALSASKMAQQLGAKPLRLPPTIQP